MTLVGWFSYLRSTGFLGTLLPKNIYTRHAFCVYMVSDGMQWGVRFVNLKPDEPTLVVRNLKRKLSDFEIFILSCVAVVNFPTLVTFAQLWGYEYQWQ